MSKWIRLLIGLLLMVLVRGREMRCDQMYSVDQCWSPDTYNDDRNCLYCLITGQRILTGERITIFTLIFDKRGNRVDLKMDYVEFYGGVIKKMPQLVQKNLSQPIEGVKLRMTRTEVLNEEFFGSSCRYWKDFKSSYNNELSVEGSAFKNCRNLEHLYLTDNQLQSLPFDAFFGLSRLIRLDLWSEGLTVWHLKWSQDLVNLEVLDLRWNKLQEIPEEALDTLIKLKKLTLTGNEIDTITKRMFQHNQQLELLDLSLNKIKRIQLGSFQHLSALNALNLEGNNCTNAEFIKKTSVKIAEGLTSCYPTKLTTCLIPDIQNGFVISTDDNSTQIVGDSVENFESVKVVCHPTYQLFHDKSKPTAIGCFEQKWQDQWPQCHSKLTLFLVCCYHPIYFILHRILFLPRTHRTNHHVCLQTKRPRISLHWPPAAGHDRHYSLSHWLRGPCASFQS